MVFRERNWLPRLSGIVLLVYLTALITGTHLPHPEELISIKTNDKWLHFGAYFGLAFLMATRLWTLRPVTWRATLAIASLVALTGIADELTQLLPGINRRCEFLDWLADLAGAVCGLLVWHLGRRVLTRRNAADSTCVHPCVSSDPCAKCVQELDERTSHTD